jgi:transcription-repair coupling factor (superfamily II helicase)
MARELLAVVAARESLEGHPYPPPDADYEEFEARFAYEDTPDQRRATEEVLRDLRRARPMDHLVCGDVGFGKTEIACRAAFMVTAAGRQVAFLVPTTVLCQQHLQTLRQRFQGTAVEVAALSRLTDPAQRRVVLEGLASGRIDLVVGTHRLLSQDVTFRNLGLIIVDEEHRFGVVHKERLKQLRKLVDVLTLTATPIPRTLQMAFTGMRDLSVISTPPPDRVAIRSQVCRFEDGIIQEAVRRELRRGGQIFFVHNRIETMQEFAGYVRGLVPEARLEIAHGQMPAAQLEKIMLRFVAHEFDVLLCTAIIESGLDIPNANTILIHRADTFGLAQLYQLRGRVGRSDRQAYAYFLLPLEGAMTADGRRRIEAIQDLSELGAGFRLATEDLVIRGAGNLLGPEQSGHVASVGYDLYMEMLEQAIAELRGQPCEPELDPEIRLPLTALLPDSYVEDVSQRLVLYKQLSSARSDAELREILDDLLDRYGPLPQEARNLADVIRLKIRCRELGIESIETSGKDLVLRASSRSRLDPKRLLALIAQPEMQLRVAPDQRLRLALRRLEDALTEAFGILELLAAPSRAQGGPPEARVSGDALR